MVQPGKSWSVKSCWLKGWSAGSKTPVLNQVERKTVGSSEAVPTGSKVPVE